MHGRRVAALFIVMIVGTVTAPRLFAECVGLRPTTTLVGDALNRAAVRGQRVLVYAQARDYGLSTQCTRTKVLDTADGEVSELRQRTRRQGLAHATQHRGS